MNKGLMICTSERSWSRCGPAQHQRIIVGLQSPPEECSDKLLNLCEVSFREASPSTPHTPHPTYTPFFSPSETPILWSPLFGNWMVRLRGISVSRISSFLPGQLDYELSSWLPPHAPSTMFCLKAMESSQMGRNP